MARFGPALFGNAICFVRLVIHLKEYIVDIDKKREGEKGHEIGDRANGSSFVAIN